MFCSACGTEGAGKFCMECGARLSAPAFREEPVESEPQGDWSQVIEYETLLRYSEVREQIAHAAAQAKSHLTGEKFLEICEKAMVPLGAPIPFAAIAKIAQPIGTALGLKTGKQCSQYLDLPPGTVVVSILCSLARHGRKLRQATQLSDGCMLDAELPSDLFALAGNLTITIRRRGAGTLLEASTHIPGQWIDWGKSTRCLNQLLAEATAAAA